MNKNIYIESRKESWDGNDLYDCYYRDELINNSFGLFSRIESDQCVFKGKVIVSGSCYYKIMVMK